MLQLEEIEALGVKAVGGDQDAWTVTQRNIYRLLVNFGIEVAKRADQIAQKEKEHAAT